MAGYTFSGDAVTRIRQTVRTVEGAQSVPQASRVNSTPLQWDYAQIGKTDDAREAQLAFREKRAPVFTGR